MPPTTIQLNNVSFAYEGAAQPLLENIHATLPQGWSGIVGANGTGKSTLMKLITGWLDPVEGVIHRPEQAIYCPQRTDEPPSMFREFFEDPDGFAYELYGRLGLEFDWLNRWNTLSHGERKRVQIALALWQRPQVLAVDEPTNHLDAGARRVLGEALHTYRGVGVLVSHDRELLDQLCQQCLFVEPPQVVVRPGGYTQGVEQGEREAAHQRKEFEKAKADQQKLKRELQRRREDASRSAKRSSKRGLAKKDYDAKSKIDHARVSGKDGVAGRLVRQMEGRLAQSQQRLEGARFKKQAQLGIWMPGEISRRKTLFELPEGTLSLGDGRHLDYPNLAMRPDERVAVVGPNGTGKSTLIAHLVERLNLEPERVIYLPQEIHLEDSRNLLNEALQLPGEALGRMMDVVSRLGSWPQRLLDSDTPSPGEIRKLMLAIGIARGPHLIVMDEPTNHLDLPAVECLEQALDDCPCGLLLVSHDQRFLNRLTHIRWQIASNRNEPNRHQLTVSTVPK